MARYYTALGPYETREIAERARAGMTESDALRACVLRLRDKPQPYPLVSRMMNAAHHEGRTYSHMVQRHGAWLLASNGRHVVGVECNNPNPSATDAKIAALLRDQVPECGASRVQEREGLTMARIGVFIPCGSADGANVARATIQDQCAFDDVRIIRLRDRAHVEGVSALEGPRLAAPRSHVTDPQSGDFTLCADGSIVEVSGVDHDGFVRGFVHRTDGGREGMNRVRGYYQSTVYGGRPMTPAEVAAFKADGTRPGKAAVEETVPPTPEQIEAYMLANGDRARYRAIAAAVAEANGLQNDVLAKAVDDLTAERDALLARAEKAERELADRRAARTAAQERADVVAMLDEQEVYARKRDRQIADAYLHARVRVANGEHIGAAARVRAPEKATAPEPTEAEMAAELDAAGWLDCTTGWADTHGDAAGLSLDQAYAAMRAAKGAK